MGHGTWVLWCCVVRCALYQYICISLYFFCYRTLFFHCVLCSSRLDLEYTCTLNRVTFILSMSNRWEQELQQCLEADVDFDVGDFIVQHPQIAPPTIRRRHASMRHTLMKRLNKRAKRGLRSSSMAVLTRHKRKPPRVQGTSQAQAAKGARNTSAAQAAKGSTGGKEHLCGTSCQGCKEHLCGTSCQGFYWRYNEHLCGTSCQGCKEHLCGTSCQGCKEHLCGTSCQGCKEHLCGTSCQGFYWRYKEHAASASRQGFYWRYKEHARVATRQGHCRWTRQYTGEATCQSFTSSIAGGRWCR